MSIPAAPIPDALPTTVTSIVTETPNHVQIHMPTRHNARLQEVLNRVNADEELYALWTVVNVNAVERLGMSDHGPVHMQIVSNIALKLLRLLESKQVAPNIVRDYKMSQA